MLTINDSEHMQQSHATRGRFPDRSLETITANYQAFMANGGIRKDAMEYRNCISEPLFNIPISQVYLAHRTCFKFYTHKQVCPPGLHMTQGIFMKVFRLLEMPVTAMTCNGPSLTSQPIAHQAFPLTVWSCTSCRC